MRIQVIKSSYRTGYITVFNFYKTPVICTVIFYKNLISFSSFTFQIIKCKELQDCAADILLGTKGEMKGTLFRVCKMLTKQIKMSKVEFKYLG